MNKIPVKIALIKDSKGLEKIAMGINSMYYFKVREDTHEKLSEFNKQYVQTIKKIRYMKAKNTPKQRSRMTSTMWWKIGRVLYAFNNKTEDEFFVTNYSTAIRRDTGISYPNEIMTFGKFLKEKQIIDKIPYYYYGRLLRKHKVLRRYGIFEQELEKLNKMGTDGNLPRYNNYRNMLAQVVYDARVQPETQGNKEKSVQTKLF